MQAVYMVSRISIRWVILFFRCFVSRLEAGPFSFRINQLGFALEPCFLQLLRPFITGKAPLDGAGGGVEDEETWSPASSQAGICLLRRLNFTEDERARVADFGQLRTDQYFAFWRKDKSNVLAVAKENGIAARQRIALVAGSQKQQGEQGEGEKCTRFHG